MHTRGLVSKVIAWPEMDIFKKEKWASTREVKALKVRK